MLNSVIRISYCCFLRSAALIVLFGSHAIVWSLLNRQPSSAGKVDRHLGGADWLPVPKAGPGCWDAASSVWFPAPPYETGSAHAKGITGPGSMGNTGGVRFSRIAGCRWSYANDSIN